MGSIPLVALEPTPPIPTPRTPLEAYSRAVSLQGLLDQNQAQEQQTQQRAQQFPVAQQQQEELLKQQQIATQQQQRQMQDQQTVMDTLRSNNGDIAASLPQLAGKVTPSTYMSLADAHLKIRKSLEDLTETELKNQAAIHDQFLGLVDDAAKLPPAEYVTQWPQIVAKAKAIDPKSAQGLDPANPVPQDQLSRVELGVQTQSAAVANKLKQSEIDKNNRSETAAQLEGKYLGIQQKKNLGQELTPEEAAFSKSYEHNKTLVPVANFNLQNGGAAADAGGKPSQIAQALANNQLKWSDAVSVRTPQSVKNSILAQVFKINPAYDTSEFGLEQDVAKKARSGAWADTRVAYNTAIDHSKQLLTAIDALNGGDVKKLNSMKNFFKTEFGSPDVPTFQAIANAYNHEVTSVVSKGHITDTEVAQGHATLGDDASPQALRSVVNAYTNLMQSKRDELDKIIKSGAGNKANSVLSTQSNSSVKTLPLAAIEKAAKDHGVSVDEAKRQAEAQGYTVR